MACSALDKKVCRCLDDKRRRNTTRVLSLCLGSILSRSDGTQTIVRAVLKSTA